MSTSFVDRRALAALASLALAASLPGAAAAGETAPELPEPEVRAEEVVVRLPRPEPAGAGAAATVVEAERFAGEAKGVAELVATAPGVAVNEYGGLGQLATASIRGSTADGVKVFLDGLPLDSAFGGGVNLSSIPRQWISSIEVVRGAEGARFGSGALGGVVNVVTRPAGAGGWSSELSYGSFDTWSAGADGSFGGDRAGALVSVGWDETSGDFQYVQQLLPGIGGGEIERTRGNNAGRRGGALVKGFALGAGGRFDLLGQVSGGTHELAGSPYDLTPDDWQRDFRGAAAARYARPLALSALLTVEASARHDRLDTRLRDVLGGRVARQRGDAGQLRLVLSWGIGAHRLEGSASVAGEEIRAEGLGPARRRAELSASVADEIALADGRLRLGPALRAERVGRFSGLSASAGATWKIAGPLVARASGGRTFRAPSFAELYLEQGLLAPNPNLEPEEAWGGSAALALEDRRGLVSAGAFASLYRDLIVYQAVFGRRLRPANAGKALVRGVEVEAASAPVGRIRATASLAYTYLHAENLRGEDAVVGRDVPRRPRHRLFARVAIAPEPFEAHAELHLVGRQYLDARNLDAIPSATTASVGGSVRVARSPAVRLHLDVRNLLDDRTLQDAFGNPLPARMLLATIRFASPQKGTP